MTTPKRPPLNSGPEIDESAFLQSYDPGDFERPSVTVDVVLLAPSEGALHTLLLKRTEHPSRGRWALPGGFVRMDEGLEEAAARVLREKAGLRGVFLEQLFTFGEPDRDPRTRIVTVSHMALVDRERLAEAEVAEGASVVARIDVPWLGEAGGEVEAKDPKGRVLPLAFDHGSILGLAVKRLRGKLDYSPVGFELLPGEFTLFELQKVHETVLGRKLNKDSFRRRLLATGLLEATGESQQDVDHRPAALYRFKRS